MDRLNFEQTKIEFERRIHRQVITVTDFWQCVDYFGVKTHDDGFFTFPEENKEPEEKKSRKPRKLTPEVDHGLEEAFEA